MNPEPQDIALDQLCVNTIRFLAVDAVEKANSGHPGMPMGMADVAYVLWTRFMRWQPQEPAWPNRDRFVLSAGHGSMLLYATLHLAGYELSMDDLQHFRQLGSRTPGHPEHGWTPGVETTTGPLGQGLANGVGLALASKMLAARFGGANGLPIDWRVFGIVSDGDLMEGISHEAAALAGHWGLGNLCYVYDDNHITIDGGTSLAYSDNVQMRFEAYGWHVERAPANDRPALGAAIERALAQGTKPSLVIARGHIGYGAPHKQDTSDAHGEPLGAAETAAAKQALGWPVEPAFLVPPQARQRFAGRAAELRAGYEEWTRQMSDWRKTHADLASTWDAMTSGANPPDLLEQLLAAVPAKSQATRAHGEAVMQAAAALRPGLIGGAADLVRSTKTQIRASGAIERGDFSGRNIHFGIRELGMGAIANGLALSGAFTPFASSFLVFTDYARPAIRLSALMGLPVVWVFTHDSLYVGEDGPTHQPVEHIASLRLIPNLHVLRPADGPETAAAWALALERREGPSLIALTRQALPLLERPAAFVPAQFRRGAYVLREAGLPTPVTIIATGSEVGVAVDAAARLEAAGIGVRVVSMLCEECFLATEPAWRDAVLPPGGRRVSLELGVTGGWYRWLGGDGLAIGHDRYGESAPWEAIAQHFGFTGEAVARRVREWLGR